MAKKLSELCHGTQVQSDAPVRPRVPPSRRSLEAFVSPKSEPNQYQYPKVCFYFNCRFSYNYNFHCLSLLETFSLFS